MIVETTVDQMAVLISKALTDYKELAADEMKKAVKNAAKTVKEEIKANAPKKTGTYSKSWTTKTLKDTSSEIEVVVYSPKRYMLAHLLENGHVLRKGGRTRAFPHIKPAEEHGLKQLENELVTALQKGST